MRMQAMVRLPKISLIWKKYCSCWTVVVIGYNIKYVAGHGRPFLKDPYSVRETGVFQLCANSSTSAQRCSWVFIHASDALEERLGEVFKNAKQTTCALQFQIHALVLLSVSDNWRTYTNYLEESFRRLVSTEQFADLVLRITIISSLNEASIRTLTAPQSRVTLIQTSPIFGNYSYWRINSVDSVIYCSSISTSGRNWKAACNKWKIEHVQYHLLFHLSIALILKWTCLFPNTGPTLRGSNRWYHGRKGCQDWWVALPIVRPSCWLGFE